MRVHHRFYGVCDQLAARQAIEHPAMTHRDAVVHADAVKLKGYAAVFADLVF